MRTLKDEIFSLRNEKYSKRILKFFKCSEGEYSYGDIFLGIKVPFIKKVCKKYYKNISYRELQENIESPYHELRFAAIWVLVLRYELEKEKVLKFYLKNKKYVNNWDLVDVSAHKILGAYCTEKSDFSPLYNLSESKNLWENRMSIVANWIIVKKGIFEPLENICEKFLTSEEDLIHKACGWMLREMGKVDENALIKFLKLHHKEMPRTMFRYANEKLKTSM